MQMYFTNKRASSWNQLRSNTTPANNSIPNPLIRIIQPQRQIQQQIPANPQLQPQQPAQKKVIWGPPIWFMLHTVAHKVKEDKFQEIRKQLLELIYAVCTNLPCPECSGHAKSYLDAINFNTIQKKEDLKRMLFEFHNAVNLRKGYAKFDYTELDEKYSKAITNSILQNFMSHFQDRPHRSIKLIATDLHRALISNKMKEWFNANIHYFDP